MAEEMKIESKNPLDDYKRLMDTFVVTDKVMSDDLIQANFHKVSEVAHKTIWKLLFEHAKGTAPKPDDLNNAAALLEACKESATFHSPWLYNEWIVQLRDELLRQGMVDFWRDIVVKRQLGPCSYKDCDMFDAEDGLPYEFYERAGCKAPFDRDTRESVTNFHAHIGDESPLVDYKKLIKEQLQSDDVVPDELLEANGNKIFEAAQQKIWQLLFDARPAIPEKLKLASEFLQAYKKDAAFYSPFMYNEWIVKVRDELLQRQMLDFWRDEIVKRELGLCWAKDSDCFDDMTDPKPEAFYKFGGCEAPFKVESADEEAAKQAEVNSALAKCGRVVPKRISMEQPVADYNAKIRFQMDLFVEKEKLKAIFMEVREVIWKCLFDADTLTEENFKKAADLLKAYKRDACTFSPCDYNDWIVRLRDELFKRNYMDFWQNVICAEKCGLCWYKDSNYFDESDVTAPMEFYQGVKDLKKFW